MLYKAVLWMKANVPSDDMMSALSLDAIKSVVDNFEPVPVTLRGLSFRIGTLTSVKISDNRGILYGTIDIDDTMSEKIYDYNIYPVVALVLKEDPKAVAHSGHFMSIGHVVLQAVQPNILIPPIEQIDS